MSSASTVELLFDSPVNGLNNATSWVFKGVSAIVNDLNILKAESDWEIFQVISSQYSLAISAGTACVIAAGLLRKCYSLRQPRGSDESTPRLPRKKLLELLKTAYIPGNTQIVKDEVNKQNVNVNEVVSPTGLTVFLCGCLSAQAELITFMLEKGADVNSETKDGDSPLYLATFAVLNSGTCDLESLRVLINAGADPYVANTSGVYPIDCAICAGQVEVAEMLQLRFPTRHVWDVVEPHTPLNIKLGLRSPLRSLLLESSKPHQLRKVFT